MIIYPEDEDFLKIIEFIFDFSKGFNAEKCPRYNNEIGYADYTAVFQRIRNDDHYLGIFEKATYLFLSIARGHFFSNGNKRMAVMSLAYFMFENGYKISPKSKSIMQMSLQDQKQEHRTVHYFFYDLAKYATSPNEDFEKLKKSIQFLLEASFQENN